MDRKTVGELLELESDQARYGMKACGLLGLPPAWVPPMSVLQSRPVARYPYFAEIEVEITEALAKFPGLAEAEHVMVRSSAPDESLLNRGRLLSLRVGNKPIAIARAASQIAKQADESGVSQLAIILQKWIHPERIGHLSNERRVASNERTWLIEQTDPEFSSQVIRVEFHEQSDQPLAAGGLGDLRTSGLETLAKHMTNDGARFHVEWVANDQILWIVQADKEPKSQGRTPFSRWTAQHKSGPVPLSIKTTRIKTSSQAVRPWPKIQNVLTLEALSLPRREIYVLEDDSLLKSLANGIVPDELASDLRELLCQPIVVRTDIIGDLNNQILPRSDCVSNFDEVCDSLLRIAMELRQGILKGNVALLMHHFISSKSGAFAYSVPNDTRVRVDSSWGVPDSLMYHPHDTYWIDLRDPDELYKTVRCKDIYIDVDENGNFVETVAGWNWDRRASLSKGEVQIIAEHTHLICKFIGSPVSVMYFVGNSNPDSSAILPWWFGKSEVLEHQSFGAPFGGRSQSVLIRNPADIESLNKAIHSGQTRSSDIAINLRPEMALLRNRSFAELVGDFAKNQNMPIVLEGSILSHAFYLLRQRGANVLAIRGEETSLTKERPLNKLVRDKIPIRIQNHSEDIEIVHVNPEDLRELLTIKLVEEAHELLLAPPEFVSEEAADVLEVLRGIVNANDISWSEIERIADAKRTLLGGFDDGVVLVSSRPISPAASGTSTELPSKLSAHRGIRPGRPHLVIEQDDSKRFRLTLPIGAIGGLNPSHKTTVELDGMPMILEVELGKEGIIFEFSVEAGKPIPPDNQLRLPIYVEEDH